jgi:hypothetical protein
MKLNLAGGSHPLDGFVNLDKDMGWFFQMGLEYENETIEAITESHGLMFLREKEIDELIRECARVLEIGGVLRITEDYSAYEGSRIFGGWRGSKILLGPGLITELMEKHGIEVKYDNNMENITYYKNNSLIQRNHGGFPRVFHIEGIKCMN